MMQPDDNGDKFISVEFKTNGLGLPILYFSLKVMDQNVGIG